jgi:hypothetical protein
MLGYYRAVILKEFREENILHKFLSSIRLSSLVIPNGPPQENNLFYDGVNELLSRTVEHFHTEDALSQSHGDPR